MTRTGWTTVFRGPVWQVIAMQARLDANEIESHAPQLESALAPLLSADATAVDLDVPEVVAERALEILARREAGERSALGVEQAAPEVVEVERLSSNRASAKALSHGGSIATKLSLIAGAALFLVSAVAQIDELWFRSDALPALARVLDKRLTAAWDYGAKVDAIGRPKPEFTTDWTVFLLFETADGRMVEGELSQPEGERTGVGGIVELVYDPNQPEHFRPRVMPRAYLFGIVLGAALTVPWLIAKWRARRS